MDMVIGVVRDKKGELGAVVKAVDRWDDSTG